MRKRLEEILLRLVRAYTFYTPIKKGRHRAYLAAMSWGRERHSAMPVTLPDGRRFSADLTTGMQTTVYFHGEYEPAVTTILSALIKPGDICLDVGANFGWYTTLMALNCGPGGEVHAFEPMPSMFRELERTYDLAGRPANMFLNELALTDHVGITEMHLFKDMPTGHASIALGDGGIAESVVVQTSTLNAYLEKANVENVDILKVDIEGAELGFLRGASTLFAQPRPPIVLMEMAVATSRHFGYSPDDLVKYIADRGDYEFYAVDENSGEAYEIGGFGPADVGANVFCVPISSDRRDALRQFLRN